MLCFSGKRVNIYADCCQCSFPLGKWEGVLCIAHGVEKDGVPDNGRPLTPAQRVWRVSGCHPLLVKVIPLP